MKLKFFCVIVLIITIEVNAEKFLSFQKSSDYYCPMDGIKLSGGMVETIGEVKSWQTCGYFCKITPDCFFWNWRYSFPRKCELLGDNYKYKYSETSLYGSGLVISGQQHCY